jgi:LCP family protein required for cell wall assembly
MDSYQNRHIKKISESIPLPPSSNAKDIRYNVLLLGGDDINQNTDTIILANFNLGDNSISFLSIPRDTRIEKASTSYKINAAYPMGGGKRTSSDLEVLLNIDISHYIYFNTQSFRNIIDILGGVEFTIPEDLHYKDPIQNLVIELNKGRQILDGKQAESFFRFRQFNSGKVTKNYDGSDLNRIKNQQNFMREFIKQKSNVKSIHKTRDIIAVLFQNFDTNMTADFILNASNDFIGVFNQRINMDILPGSPKYINKTWYYIIDQKSSNHLIKKNFQTRDS